MRNPTFLLAASLPLLFALVHFGDTQSPFQIDARNTIPDTIQGCYRNHTAYNRFTRQPMHIDNLIRIIRKIEDKTDDQWDIRRISRTLVHRYMYDGMMFFKNAKTEFEYRQKPEENTKTLMIKDLINMPNEEFFPDYILDNDDKCALHWMMSHSLNATLRDDEYNQYQGYDPYSNNNGNGFGSSNNNNNGYNNNNNGYNNNNNGYNSNGNGNPSMGNNYNRGRRDVGNQTEESAEDSDDSKEPVYASNEPDDYDMKEQEQKDASSGASLKLKSSEEDNQGDVIVFGPGTGSKSGRQVSQPDYSKKSRRPIETGVVYTKWGSINAGRLIAGIAAGLQSSSMSTSGVISYNVPNNVGGPNPWSGGSGISNSNNNNNNNNNNPNTNPNSYGSQSAYGNGQSPWKSGNNNGGQPSYPMNVNNRPQQGQDNGRRYKRQVGNVQALRGLYAATLAGDAGHAAILNAPYKINTNTLPAGEFNDTVCPREYALFENPDPNVDIHKPNAAWTFITEAEVRGGVDGFLLGANIQQWDPSATLRLSDVLSQYYSEAGISSQPNFRSCERSSLLSQSSNNNEMFEQVKSFAYIYNNRTGTISADQTSNPNVFDDLVREAFNNMWRTATSFSGANQCLRSSGGGNDYNDNMKYVVPKLTVYAVLDQSATVREIEDQKRFLGQLTYEIDVSPAGSRLGVVDGNSGNVIFSPNWTDSSSMVGCRIMQIVPVSRGQDYARVLTNLRSELERVKNEEQRNNYTLPNGVVILLLVQGNRLGENQRDDIIRLTEEINEITDASVIATSSKYAENDFEGIDFIPLPQTQGNFSDLAREFAERLLRSNRTQGSLRYIQCNSDDFDQDYEHLLGTNLYITPNTIEYYRISPDYFFSARALVLRFSSYNGRVRICYSRTEPYPNVSNQELEKVQCNETTGNYIPAGQNEIDVEFKGNDNGLNLNRPCGKKGKREECDPIYISITPIQTVNPGQPGLDCSQEPCQSANQVRVTWTHWNMRCNSGTRGVFSATVAIITLSLALFNWLKAT